MAKIIVNTQAELDAIPQDFDGVIAIYGGTPSNPIVVKSDYCSATVWACNSATVRAHDSATVWAFGFSQVVKCSRCATIETHEQARCIASTEDLDVFCTYHSIRRNEDKSIWYKAVHKRGSGYVADYDSKTNYTVGKTKTVKNLDANREKECGSGIHIAPLRWAVEFGKDWDDLAILEVEAATKSIVLPYESDGKVRVKSVKVLREVPLEECGALGKMIAKRNAKESEG